MKKKLLCLALSAACSLSLVACSSSDYDFVILPEYKGIKVATIETTEITDAEVTARALSNLNAHVTYETVTDRAVQSGDIVNMDISGRVNEAAYTGSDVSGYDIEIGNDSIVPGFDSAIIARSIGDSFTINLTFPEDHYLSEVAGEDVEYQVTINGIRRKITPELSDEFIPHISTTATTVEEYQLEVRKQLENEASSVNKDSVAEQAFNYLMQYSEIEEYPSAMLNDEVSIIEDQYIRMADLSGVSLDVYVSNHLNMDEDSFKEHTMTMAKYLLLEKAVIHRIAELEELIPTDDEYIDYYQSLLITKGYSDVSELLAVESEESLQFEFLTSIVKSFLVEHVVQTDK